MRSLGIHQYIERETSAVKTEKLISDRLINFVYSELRENTGAVFNMLVSPRCSAVLACVCYDFLFKRQNVKNIAANAGIDLSECVEPRTISNARQLFERRIRYWETRPMPDDLSAVVSPADARVLVGSFCETSELFVKNKFFSYEELIGSDKKTWLASFSGGDFAVCRLTPDKYHYNHVPVSGVVVDFYEITGLCHSCNPGAVISAATPFSKNKRTVTIIDTDVRNGSSTGLVAMIEVSALMIGDVTQCYSTERYDAPRPVLKGLFLEKGSPKSLYHPGSSVDIIIFQRNRIRFASDLLENLTRTDVASRFSVGLGKTIVETDVKVRSIIASRRIYDDT